MSGPERNHAPDSLERVRKNAFLGCERFVKVNLPDNIETLEPDAFPADLALYVTPGSKTARAASQGKFLAFPREKTIDGDQR